MHTLILCDGSVLTGWLGSWSEDWVELDGRRISDWLFFEPLEDVRG